MQTSSSPASSIRLSSSSCSAGAIEYLTPPGMTASPIYCRVAKVLSPSTIYTAGIFVNAGLDGEKEVAEVIHKLGDILRQTGSARPIRMIGAEAMLRF